MRRSPTRTIATFAAVLTLGVLAGCGGSSSDDAAADKTTSSKPRATTTSSTEPEADAVAPATWAATFCEDLGVWTAAIGTASEAVGEGVEVGDPASSQMAVSGLYGESSTATQAFIDEIEAAGVPDIEKGDQFVADLVEAFESFDAAAIEAKAGVEALATDDIAAFQADIDELGAGFQTAIDEVSYAISELGTTYPSTELNNALTESCA